MPIQKKKQQNNNTTCNANTQHACVCQIHRHHTPRACARVHIKHNAHPKHYTQIYLEHTHGKNNIFTHTHTKNYRSAHTYTNIKTWDTHIHTHTHTFILQFVFAVHMPTHKIKPQQNNNNTYNANTQRLTCVYQIHISKWNISLLKKIFYENSNTVLNLATEKNICKSTCWQYRIQTTTDQTQFQTQVQRYGNQFALRMPTIQVISGLRWIHDK